MTNTPEQAIAAARNQSANGPRSATGMCLRMVRECYGVGAAASDATSAWTAAKRKHRTTDPASIPRGAPVFWSGGSHGYGHIAIATGAGACWSTDIERLGFFDKVPIDRIRVKWGLTLLGWTEDLNGADVFTPPAPADRTTQEDEVTPADEAALANAIVKEFGSEGRIGRAIYNHVKAVEDRLSAIEAKLEEKS